MHHEQNGLFATPRPMFIRRLALTMLLAAALAPAGSARAGGGEPIALEFSAFFARPVGPRGLEPSPALRAADGRLVRLTGFMVQREQPEPGGFLLAPLPVHMSEHADGDADDLPASTVHVRLDPSQRDRVVAHVPGRIALVGTLSLGRAESEDGTGRISWVRLQLAPDALALQPLP